MDLTQSLKNMISSAATSAGVPVGLYTGLVQQESSFNPNAVSSSGAYGYAQLMPGTAQGLGVNAYDPQQNLNGGASYLRQMYDKFGNWGDAVAAYNAGPSGWANVLSGRSSVPSETASYVPAVMDYAKQYGFDIATNGSSSPQSAVDNANASQGSQGTSVIGSILSGIMSKIPNSVLPAAGDPTRTQAEATANAQSPLLATINKIFTAEFWQSAAAFVMVLIIAAAFLIFGASRIVKSN